MAHEMTAYFYTEDKAKRAADRLGVQFHSTAPEPVSSVLGRPWRIVITLPDGPLAQYPDPLYADQVVGVVMTYDGVVHSQDQP